MTITLIGTITLILALAALFGWLAARAWRARRALIKWPGALASGLLALLCLVIAGTALLGLFRVYWPGDRPVAAIQVEGTPEQRARGERLANMCAGCHSTTGGLPLDGGSASEIGALGTLVAPNLTPGGSLSQWSDGEIMRAIREGVHKDGRSLLLMPSEHFHVMSDDDVQSLVAYLRTQPVVEHPTPETELTLLGAIIIGAGVFPVSLQPPLTAPAPAPAGGPTPEYGRYLATLSGCSACHGENLQGGTSSFTPIGPNLPAILAQWSADDFVTTMRTGVDPYGNTLDASTMPWENFSAAYTDEELRAIYEYIRTLAPAPAAIQ